jgi:hypothetical protein
LTRRVAIIQGHPDPAGHHLLHAIADAYAEGPAVAGYEVRHIEVAKLEFPLSAPFRQGVFEYTHHSKCLFRIEVTTCRNDIVLSDGAHVHPGDRLICLRMWNEQFPAFPGASATLAWARRFNRAFDISLRELAHFLDVRRHLDNVTAICGHMSFEPAKRSAQLARFVSRFGFEKIALPSSRSFRQACIGSARIF